jgi:SAM-dependent methyltransferase
MSESRANRFQAFFENSTYAGLKNLLYNYRLRKHSVAKHVRADDLVLEIGSGLSPMITGSDAVVYSDISASALGMLRRHFGHGYYVAADARRLPFKSEAFQTIVCSEVLEHIEDDERCIRQMRRVLSESGRLVVTFPHRRAYFSNDDRYVAHHRRYELQEMKEKLGAAGFETNCVKKVLGPLEKITMMLAVACISRGKKSGGNIVASQSNRPLPLWLLLAFDIGNRLYMGPVWLASIFLPLSFASVLLIVARVRKSSKIKS